MLFWALLASGQINMRKIDGWQTLATKPIDQPIDLAASNHITGGTRWGRVHRLSQQTNCMVNAAIEWPTPYSVLENRMHGRGSGKVLGGA
jgi:hypothetical protein